MKDKTTAISILSCPDCGHDMEVVAHPDQWQCKQCNARVEQLNLWGIDKKKEDY